MPDLEIWAFSSWGRGAFPPPVHSSWAVLCVRTLSDTEDFPSSHFAIHPVVSGTDHTFEQILDPYKRAFVSHETGAGTTEQTTHSLLQPTTHAERRGALLVLTQLRPGRRHRSPGSPPTEGPQVGDTTARRHGCGRTAS